jgi:N-terminal domain of oxidoreductase
LRLPSREPNEGQVLLRTLYLSLDPYMRQVMNEAGPKYAPSVRLGEPMVARKLSWRTVAVLVAVTTPSLPVALVDTAEIAGTSRQAKDTTVTAPAAVGCGR